MEPPEPDHLQDAMTRRDEAHAKGNANLLAVMEAARGIRVAALEEARAVCEQAMVFADFDGPTGSTYSYVTAKRCAKVIGDLINMAKVV